MSADSEPSTIKLVIQKYVSKINTITKSALKKCKDGNKIPINDKNVTFYRIKDKYYMQYYGIYRTSPPNFKTLIPLLKQKHKNLKKLFSNNMYQVSDGTKAYLISLRLTEIILDFKDTFGKFDKIHAQLLLEVFEDLKFEINESETDEEMDEEYEDNDEIDEQKENDDSITRFSQCINPFTKPKSLKNKLEVEIIPELPDDFRQIFLDEDEGYKYYRSQIIFMNSPSYYNRKFKAEKLNKSVVAINADPTDDTSLYNEWYEAIEALCIEENYSGQQLVEICEEIIEFINANFYIEKHSNTDICDFQVKRIYQNEYTLIAHGLLRSDPAFYKYKTVASEYSTEPVTVKMTNRPTGDEDSFAENSQTCLFDYHIQYFPPLTHKIGKINIICSHRYAGSMATVVKTLNMLPKVEDSQHLRVYLASIMFTKHVLSKMHIRFYHKSVNLDNKPSNWFYVNTNIVYNIGIQTKKNTNVKTYCLTIPNPMVGDLGDMRGIDYDEKTVTVDDHGSPGYTWENYTKLCKYSSKPLATSYLEYIQWDSPMVKKFVEKLEDMEMFADRLKCLMKECKILKEFRPVAETICQLIEPNDEKRIDDKKLLDHKFFYQPFHKTNRSIMEITLCVLFGVTKINGKQTLEQKKDKVLELVIAKLGWYG